MRNPGIRAVGGLALGVLFVAGLGGPVAAVNTIDPTPESMSITLHKHLHQVAPGPEGDSGSPEGSPAGSPAALEGEFAAPLAGVVFTAYPLEFRHGEDTLTILDAKVWELIEVLAATDLAGTTPAGTPPAGTPPAGTCAGARAAVEAAVAGGTPASTATVATTGTPFPATNAAGLATLELGVPGSPTADLGLGAYLICETSPGANLVIHTAAPFLVTVPFPHEYQPAGSTEPTFEWLYQVHAYPKNSATMLEMVADAPATPGLGATVNWTIQARVPISPAGISSFTITDQLDSRLHYLGYEVSLAGTALQLAPADYTVTGPHPDPDPLLANTFTLTFTESGLAKLASLPSLAAAVVLTLHTAVSGVGEIPNSATVLVDGVSHDTATAVSDWGDLRVLNHDQLEAPLAGATFEVFAGSRDAQTGECAKVPEGQPVAIADATTFTSGPDGTTLIPGLYASGSSSCYVLEQVALPPGYVLPKGEEALYSVAVESGISGSPDLIITNFRHAVPELPLTGSQGKLLLTVGGVALLLLAGGLGLTVARGRSSRQ